MLVVEQSEYTHTFQSLEKGDIFCPASGAIVMMKVEVPNRGFPEALAVNLERGSVVTLKPSLNVVKLQGSLKVKKNCCCS